MLGTPFAEIFRDFVVFCSFSILLFLLISIYFTAFWCQSVIPPRRRPAQKLTPYRSRRAIFRDLERDWLKNPRLDAPILKVPGYCYLVAYLPWIPMDTWDDLAIARIEQYGTWWQELLVPLYVFCPSLRPRLRSPTAHLSRIALRYHGRYPTPGKIMTFAWAYRVHSWVTQHHVTVSRDRRTRRRTAHMTHPNPNQPERPYTVRARRFGAFEDLVNTPVATTVLAPELKAYLTMARHRYSSRYSYAKALHAPLERSGILTNPHGLAHPHGANKTLEDRNTERIATLLKAVPFTSISSKASTFQRMAVAHHNVALTGKDWCRYDNATNRPVRVNTEVAVMHDVLHYLNPADISELFAQNGQLRTLFATAVIPPELLSGEPPQWPSLYDFRLRGDQLVYVPEGHAGGQYTQPAACKEWLTTNRIVCPDFVLTVSMVESDFAHHVFVIHRADYLPEATRAFDAGDYTRLPAWLCASNSPYDTRVRTSLINKMMLFADRYPGTAIQDFHAKVSQVQMALTEDVPYAELNAAAHAAHRMRLAQLGLAPNLMAYFSSILFLLWNALLTPSLLFSPNSIRWTTRAEGVFTYECHSVSADAWQPTLWTTRRRLAPANDFSLSRHSSMLQVFATVNMALTVWVLPKVLISELLDWAVTIDHVEDIWNDSKTLIRYADLRPKRVLIVVVIAWLAARGVVNIPVTPVRMIREASHVTYMRLLAVVGWLDYYDWGLLHTVSSFYGLSGCHLFGTAGYSWWWQAYIAYWAAYTVFPLYPLWRPYHAHPLALFKHLPFCIPTFGYFDPFGSRPTVFPHSHFNYSWGHNLASGLFWVFMFCWVWGCWSRQRRGIFPQWFLDYWAALTAPREDGLFLPIAREPVRNYGTMYVQGLHDRGPDAPAPQLVDPAVRPPDAVLDVPGWQVPTGAEHAGYMRPLIPTGGGVPPGNDLHPYRNWYRQLPTNGAPEFFRLLDALPHIDRPVQERFSCFWNCLATALGHGTPARIMALYLAHVATDDIVPEFHHGLVRVETMTQACVLFGIGLNVRRLDEMGQDVGQNALPAVPALPGFPTVDLIMRPVTLGPDGAFHVIPVARRMDPPNFRRLEVAPYLEGGPNAARPARLPVLRPGVNPVVDMVGDVPDAIRVPRVMAAFGQQPREQRRDALEAIDALGELAGMGPEFVGLNSADLEFNDYRPLIAAVPREFADTLPSFRGLQMATPAQRQAANVLHREIENEAPGPVPMMPRVVLQPSHYRFTPDRAVADILAQDLRDFPNLWLVRDSDRSAPAQQRAMVKFGEAHEIELVTLFGVPGCGKTTAARRVLADSGIHVTSQVWAFPSPLLAGDALQKPPAAQPLGPDANSSQYVTGLEVLRKGCGELVVLDDFTRWPPGTIDWLVFNNPSLRMIVLTGDPAQTQTSFPEQTALSRTLKPIGGDLMSRPLLKENPPNYATVSWRLPQPVAELFGFHSAPGVRLDGHVTVVSKPPPDIPLLVTSPRFAETKTHGGTPAYVIATSQGLEFDGDYCVDLGGMTDAITDASALVALTRGRRNVFLYWPQETRAVANFSWSTTPILGSLVSLSSSQGAGVLVAGCDWTRMVPRAVYSHIVRTAHCSIPGFRPSGFIGVNDGIPSLLGAPVTTEHVNRAVAFQHPQVGRIQRAQSRKAVLTAPVDGLLHTVVPAPTVPADPVHHHAWEEFGDREARELRAPGIGATHQFPDHKHAGAQHHARQDRATERKSLDKRLKMATPAANRRNIYAGRSRYVQLKNGFLTQFPNFRRPREMEGLFEQCVEECLDSWMTKRTLKDIQRALVNEPPDWDKEQTRVFLKTQVVRKRDTWGGPAKAGQIVTTFPVMKTFRDAVYALALERVLLADCPPHVMLYLRKTPADLAGWIERHMGDTTVFTENDYTAWDSSIDGPFVKFDLWLLRQIGVPEEYLATWAEERCSTTCFMGNLRLMQHSGDRYTFLLNTVRNLAITNAQYAGMAGRPQAYGGDDSLVAGRPDFAKDFRPSHWLMDPKTHVGPVGHLFGFEVRDGKVTYDWRYMRNRLSVGLVERATDYDFFVSFAVQLRDFPNTDDELYASVYAELVAHCHRMGWRIPGLPDPPDHTTPVPPCRLVKPSWRLRKQHVFPQSQNKRVFMMPL